MTTVWGIVLPARDSKDRADARIPSKCTVCRKRGEMETTRGEWENDQRVNERCHARLPDIQCLTRNTSPIPPHFLSARHKGSKKTNAPPNAVARTQRIPTLLPEEEAREFRRDEVVDGREASGGDEQRGEVISQVQREDCGHSLRASV